MIVSVVLIILGFALLIKGADFLVDGASSVAKKFHIPEIIIGLTVVSIGTSMPELVVSVTSAMEGYSDMAIGNVLGSNVCNMLLILGLSSIIRTIKFQKETRHIEIPFCLAFTILFMLLCNSGNMITRYEAVVLIGLFALFIIYTILLSSKDSNNEELNSENETEETTPKNNDSIIKNIFKIILGVVALKIGGDLCVDNAVVIANYFNISEKIISLTILAVGTSLPELVTSVMAAIKGNSDIAIGNIIGSNIFNMLLIIGVASLINPITYNTMYNIDMLVSIIATVVLAIFPMVKPKNEMSRGNGIVYLLMYIGYLAILFNV